MSAKLSYASPDDWVRHRARICNLYEKNTLKKVIQIMKRDHGFSATPKMYKTRIAAWEQDKNRKGHEMRAIAAKVHLRRSEHKETLILIRGKAISYESVAAYFSRRGIDVEEIATARREVRTPPTLICLTPPPLPFSVSPLSSSISPPTALAVPEEALRWMERYARGSFESRSWYSVSEHEYPVSSKFADAALHSSHGGLMDTLHNRIMTACFLFTDGRALEAGNSLSSATEGVKELTRFQYPALIDRLPRTLLATAVDNKRPEIAFAVLREFAAYAKLYHGDSHPLFRVFMLLASMDLATLISAMHLMVHSIASAFEDILGPFHRTTLAARYTHVRTVLASQGKDAEAEGFRQIVRHCELCLPEGDLRTVKARTDFTLFLQRARLFVEGRVEAQKIVDETMGKSMVMDMDKRAAKLCARGYSCLAGCEYGLGRIDEAIVQKKIVIELFKSLGDEHVAHVEEEGFWLGEWLKEADRKRTETLSRDPSKEDCSF